MRHLYHSSSAAFRSYDIWFENCLGMHMVDWKHKGRVICIKRVVSPKGWMDGTWYTFSTFPSVIGICPPSISFNSATFPAFPISRTQTSIQFNSISNSAQYGSGKHLRNRNHCYHWRWPFWVRHLIHVCYYWHITIQMLFQPRLYSGRLHRSKGQCTGWNYCFYGGWVLVGGFDFWISFR